MDDDDDDEDEGEGEGDGLFLFFFLSAELLLLLPYSRWGEWKDDLFLLGGVGLLLTLLRLGVTSLSKEEEVSFPPFFFVESS